MELLEDEKTLRKLVRDAKKIVDLGEFLSESEPRCAFQSLSRYEAGKGFPLPSLSQHSYTIKNHFSPSSYVCSNKYKCYYFYNKKKKGEELDYVSSLVVGNRSQC